MGKCKALETALNNKLLSSHEHLEKGVFSPPPCKAVSVQTYLFIDSLSRASDRGELDCKLAKQQICAGRR